MRRFLDLVHQPLHFNYSVGLRLPWLQRLMSFFVYLPPAFLGFSAALFADAAHAWLAQLG